MADYVYGGGSGGASGAPASRLWWDVGYEGNEMMWAKGSYFNQRRNESLADYIKRSKGKDDSYINKIRLYAYVRSIYGSKMGNTPTEYAYTNSTKGAANWDTRGNWGWGVPYKKFPSELKDPSLTGLNIGSVDSGIIIYDYKWNPVSAIWVDTLYYQPLIRLFQLCD